MGSFSGKNDELTPDFHDTGFPKGTFVIAGARCLSYGEAVRLDCSTYQNNYECPVCVGPVEEGIRESRILAGVT